MKFLLSIVMSTAACGAHTRTEVSVDAPVEPDAPLVLADAPPISCGDDAAPCVGLACSAVTCITPAHIPTGFGTFARAQLDSITILDDAATWDTNTGAIAGVRAANAATDTYEVVDGVGFIRRTQVDAPPLAIWVFGDLVVRAPMTASGDASMIVASASDLRITAAGSFDLGARGLVPGPGGSLGGTFRTAGDGCGGGGAPAGAGTSGDTGGTDGGGGGGGFGTDGGAGGSGSGVRGSAGAGSACNAILASVLVGGSGGAGADTSGTVPGPFGGGGGGALQLTAMGELEVAGGISVGGGGGRTAVGNSRDGAGGGSGGAVYLEAPQITLAATGGVFANGGGGGSASAGTGSSCSGALAQDGQPNLTAALGSHCAIGFGGDGAVGTTTAKAGADSGAAGGGGGGLGRIVLHTVPGGSPVIDTTSLSPPRSLSIFQIDRTL